MTYTRLNPDADSGSGTIANVSGVANTSTYSWARYGKVVTVNVTVKLSAAAAIWTTIDLLTNMPHAVKEASCLISVDNAVSQAKLLASTSGVIYIGTRGGNLSSGAVLNGSITYICT